MKISLYLSPAAADSASPAPAPQGTNDTSAPTPAVEPEAAKLDSSGEDAQLRAENQRLKDELDALHAADLQEELDAEVIKAKMAVGLTREQALAVIARQRQYDAVELPKREARVKAQRAVRQRVNTAIQAALTGVGAINDAAQ